MAKKFLIALRMIQTNIINLQFSMLVLKMIIWNFDIYSIEIQIEQTKLSGIFILQ